MTLPAPGPDLLAERRAGVLLHPSSLPSAGNSGDLGAEAFRFVDFLAGAGFSVWQMLPVGPTHEDRSPYQSLSVHAGDTELVATDSLLADGLLLERDLSTTSDKRTLLRLAAERFLAEDGHPLAGEFETFCGDNSFWLDDYALFLALREEHQGLSWNEWPAPLRHREPDAVELARRTHAGDVATHQFGQFIFHRQWQALRDYSRERGVHLFGDMPIFVSHDSADVWANQRLFQLDSEGRPTSVAGVPPDYFSDTGQHWGNPHYDWAQMQSEGFGWWLDRVRHQLRFFDLLRIDHFRGFEAYWEIPAEAPDPRSGRWVKAPGEAFLFACREAFHELPFVAENLGFITPEVEALRAQFQLPGMLILQFAFDGSAENPYLPHNHEALEVVYTGTHDNNTTLGWYQSLSQDTVSNINAYFGDPGDPMPDFLVKTALASVARLAVVPMQDLLGLGEGHRMNTPGTAEGNWHWQFHWDQVQPGRADQLREWLSMYRRLVTG